MPTLRILKRGLHILDWQDNISEVWGGGGGGEGIFN